MPRYGNQPRTGKYNDWGKTYKGFSQALLGSGKALNQIALTELQEVAHKYLKELDAEWPHSTTVTKIKWGKNNVQRQSFGGDATHPWYSGQLHDSVAVRIMQKNRIASVQYMPPSPDTGKPQHTETIGHIVGAEWAREIAEMHGPRYFLPGVQVQLIVAVPYADKVNEDGRHAGFADDLANDLFSEVNQWVFDGGLSRNVLTADEKGNVKITKRSNIKKM